MSDFEATHEFRGLGLRKTGALNEYIDESNYLYTLPPSKVTAFQSPPEAGEIYWFDEYLDSDISGFRIVDPEGNLRNIDGNVTGPATLITETDWYRKRFNADGTKHDEGN